MDIFLCTVLFDDGHAGHCDGIVYMGKRWLITGWMKHHTEPHSIPSRIICFDDYHFQHTPGQIHEYHNISLPFDENAINGDLPSTIQFVDLPDIKVDRSKVVGH